MSHANHIVLIHANKGQKSADLFVMYNLGVVYHKNCAKTAAYVQSFIIDSNFSSYSKSVFKHMHLNISQFYTYKNQKDNT